MDRLRQLIHEIHRRSLWQVLGVYVAGAVAVLGGAGTLADALRLPEWFVPLALGLLIVGLPIVLATAFVQEGGPGNEPRPGPAPIVAGGRAAKNIFTWRNALGGGVLAFALWGVVAAGWLLSGTVTREPPSGAPIERSVAVMPCVDNSPAGDQGPLANGISERVIDALSRFPDLKVSALSSTQAMQSEAADLRTIANTLGVANVLECSLTRDGDRLQVVARLTDATTTGVLWSNTFDEEFGGLLQVLDAITRAVTDRLQLVFDDADRLLAEETGVPAALDQYLRGRLFAEQRSRMGMRRAIDAFEAALEADPSYSLAYSGLALAYQVGSTYGYGPNDSMYVWAGKASTYANRAIELDSLNAEAYGVRAWASLRPPLPSGDVLPDMEHALELRPGSADVLSWYAQGLSVQGRHEEALDLHERVLELDPLSPGRPLGYAFSALLAGRYELAIRQARRARQLQPNAGGFYRIWETLPLLLLGRAEECPELLASDDSLLAFEAICLYESDRVSEAEAIVDSLSTAWSAEDALWIADGLTAYFAWTGNVDRALSWLEIAFGTSPHVQSAWIFETGVWDPVLEVDEERVRTTVMALANEAWERESAESRSVELP